MVVHLLCEAVELAALLLRLHQERHLLGANTVGRKLGGGLNESQVLIAGARLGGAGVAEDFQDNSLLAQDQRGGDQELSRGRIAGFAFGPAGRDETGFAAFGECLQ